MRTRRSSVHFPPAGKKLFGWQHFVRCAAPAAAIRTLAQSFQAQSGLSAKDALHLACAAQVGAVCFVTCDDGLIRQAKRLRLALAILNPVDYVRQVEK